MRSSPTNNNNTLLKIQQEISEVTARENELRSLYQQQHSSIESETDASSAEQFQNGINRAASPITPPVSPSPPILTKNLSSTITTNNQPAFTTTASTNGNGVPQNGLNTTRRLFVPNPHSSKGVMQKFFKARGKVSTVATISNNVSTHKPSLSNITWHTVDILDQPAKALIPADKPLRKGYVPVEQKIQKELRELKEREEELRTERRKSQPDLMAALEREQANSLDSYNNSQANSRSSSPLPFPGRLRNSRSYSQLLDEENYIDDNNSMPTHPLRPARSLAELCDVSDEEVIEKPKNLIQQWESRIRQSQESNH